MPGASQPFSGLTARLARGRALAAAYGSFFVASLVWCALTLPVRRFSFIGLFARFLRAPIISGMIVLLVIIQISNVALPNWIGVPSNSGFPVVNILAGAVAVAVVIGVMLWGGPRPAPRSNPRGLAAGTACYALFRPISLRSRERPILVTPHWFPFGFGVQTNLVIVFLLVLIPPGMGSMAMYQMVADWEAKKFRGAHGAGCFRHCVGSVSCGDRRWIEHHRISRQYRDAPATRVGSRYATLSAGIVLVATVQRRRVRHAARGGPGPNHLRGGDAALWASSSCTGCTCSLTWIGTNQEICSGGTCNSDWARGNVRLARGAAKHAPHGTAHRAAAGNFRRPYACDPALAPLQDSHHPRCWSAIFKKPGARFLSGAQNGRC